MMNKRFFAIALTLFTVISLACCRLAIEDMGEDAGVERLMGVFITTEYLDLFDHEGYLNDNLKNASGGEIIMDGSTGKYEGRMYAEKKKRALKSEETGEETIASEYVFDAAEGLSFFVYEEEGSLSSSSAETVSDGNISIHDGDKEQKISLECTVCQVFDQYFEE